MKKAFCLMLGIMILSIAAVSAQTTIAGKIYNHDYTEVIEGADVTVTCGGNVLTYTSLADGAYSVTYLNEVTGAPACTVGDTLTVEGSFGDLYGIKQGTLVGSGDCTDPASENCVITIANGFDLAVVNVPLVPEFGLVVGVATALSAVALFFVVRKNN